MSSEQDLWFSCCRCHDRIRVPSISKFGWRPLNVVQCAFPSDVETRGFLLFLLEEPPQSRTEMVITCSATAGRFARLLGVSSARSVPSLRVLAHAEAARAVLTTAGM